MTGIRNQESGVRSQGAGVSGRSIAVGSCRLLSIALGLLLAVPALAQQNATTELTDKAAEAIDKGLKHLLQMQRADGSWAAGDEGERAMAITSLSLMAFMSKAQFPGSGPNGDALNRAKDWLLKQAEDAPGGYLGTTMY